MLLSGQSLSTQCLKALRRHRPVDVSPEQGCDDADDPVDSHRAVEKDIALRDPCPAPRLDLHESQRPDGSAGEETQP
jgi:hypothetical protein